MLTTLVLFAALQAGASPVDPRDPFAGLLRAMERDGFEIKETQEVAGAGGRQLAATFRKTSDTDGSREELHVYVESAEGPRLVHRRAADVSAFWLAGFQDVTGDGIPELVVRFSCGGTAWRCQRLGVLQIRGEEVVELTRLRRGTLFPSALADLDGDGVPELVVSDSRWETYPELDHVNAPRLERIFRWTGTGYEHASALFPQRALRSCQEVLGSI